MRIWISDERERENERADKAERWRHGPAEAGPEARRAGESARLPAEPHLQPVELCAGAKEGDPEALSADAFCQDSGHGSRAYE